MKDKDTLFLESMYLLIAESKRVENELKTRYNLDDDTVKELFTIDTTGGKVNALIFGKWLSQGSISLDELKELCAKAKSLEGKHPEVKNIQQIKTAENFKNVIARLDKKNSLVDAGLSKEQVTKLLSLDKTPDQSEAIRIAFYIKNNKDLGIEIPPDDIIREYEKFLELREQNVEGSQSIEPYADYAAFTEYLHLHVKNEDDENSKIVSLKVDTTPIVDDEIVTIWDTDSIRKCIKVGNEMGKKLDLKKHFPNAPWLEWMNCNWCITYPAGAPNASNLYANYRFKPTQWSFYMVYCKKREKNDRYIFVAIGVLNNGNYTLTYQANNAAPEISWEELVGEIPEIAPHKAVFKHHVLTDKERESVRNFEAFHQLLRGANLNDPRQIQRVTEMFSEFDDDEKRDLIAQGLILPIEVFKILSKTFKNLYIETLATSVERVGDNSSYIKKLKAELTPPQLARFDVVHDRALINHILGVDQL
jgi:hypothetical protein